MNSAKIGQISITLKAWEKLAESLPRDHNGHIRRGALKERMSTAIEQWVDREESKYPRGAV